MSAHHTPPSARTCPRARTSATRTTRVDHDLTRAATALYKLKLNELITTIPTIGFNVEHVKYKNLEMNIWDVGGQDKIRALWRHYYENSDAIIWLVDSTDLARLNEARDELHRMLADDLLRDARVLVLANKQDLPNALPAHKVADHLGLHSLHGRQWYVQACSAANGSGLYEGLEWLYKSRPKAGVLAAAA